MTTDALPSTPCPPPQDLLDDMLYEPGPYLLRELLELDADKSLVPRWRSAATRPSRSPARSASGPGTRPTSPARCLVHLTGAAGFVHAYYLLGLRHRDGWVGFGTHIHRAVFRKLDHARRGLRDDLPGHARRPGRDRYMVRYDLEVRRNGARCYQGDQSAAWMRGRPRAFPRTSAVTRQLSSPSGTCASRPT